MGDEKINVRSYVGYNQKKLAIAAILFCWIMIALNLCGVLKPFIRRPLLYLTNKYTSKNPDPIIFTYNNTKTEVFDVSGDVRIQGSSAAIFIASNGRHRELPETAKPLPRKQDARAMTFVTSFTMTTGPPDTIPQCTRYLDAPAILFSTGHIGNHFHQIANVLIPLFTTSHHFHNHVLFLVADHDSRVVAKHRKTLKQLSEYEAYNIDVEDEILCFPRLIVGLRARTIGLSIDPTPSANFTMRNFTNLMRTVYSLKRSSVYSRPTKTPTPMPRRRPRILIITRTTTRRLMNHVEVVEMARSLGFEPVAQDFGKSLASTAKFVNTVDVMIGVHGAGLTNMVFLPENAVVVQITPLGLDSYGDYYYGKDQVKEMKLKYLEYKVGVNESTLVGKYPPESEIYTHSNRLCNQDYRLCKAVFLDEQDVILDLARFKNTLSQALELFAAAS